MARLRERSTALEMESATAIERAEHETRLAQQAREQLTMYRSACKFILFPSQLIKPHLFKV